MKILKILGIAAGLHALALLLIFANPGCSYTKAAAPDPSPISAAPAGDASITAPSAGTSGPDSVGIRYSPTRPGTAVAAALETQPVSDVTPVSTYTVTQGDSLSSIAKRNHLTKAELASANSLRSGATLHIGQRLIIPTKEGEPAPVAAPTSFAPKVVETAPSDKGSVETIKHVVKPGETLGAIARKYGVKQGEIAVANNITDPRKIQPGQELIIPAKSGTSAKQSKAAKARADATDTAKTSAGKTSAPSAADQDLDAGLKPSSPNEVPVVKIEDPSTATPPKNP